MRKAHRSDLVFVDGDEWVTDGYRFICTPWAQKPATRAGESLIVLCHAPPLKTEVSSDAGWEAGDDDVAEATHALFGGSLTLSGHVHSPPTWHARMGDVWCFNPGVDFHALTPNHIVIDTTVARATWVTEQAGRRQVDLRIR